MEFPYSYFLVLFLLFSFEVQQLSRYLEFCNMEKVEDKERKRKGFFSTDQLISGKRNVNDEDMDLELRLGPPLNDNSVVEYSKKPKIVSPSNSGDKSKNEFQFSLIRTSSLSLEAEEKWEKQEKLQSPKHMEAIQKRLEKMKSITGVYKKSEEIDGSSSVPVIESQPIIQGPSDVSRLGSGESLKLLQKLIVAILKISNENSPVLSAYIAQAKWLLKYLMIKMRRVSTRGDGPNGNKTDGLLLAYEKGEDVQIVCICHGNFLSPAEFVKHAGGGDVENPLRHIIVNPLPM